MTETASNALPFRRPEDRMFESDEWRDNVFDFDDPPPVPVPSPRMFSLPGVLVMLPQASMPLCLALAALWSFVPR